MDDRIMPCYTCKSDEEHRPLTSSERDWLKKDTGRKNVDNFFVCTAPGCRNLRTGFNQHPFDHVKRLPQD